MDSGEWTHKPPVQPAPHDEATTAPGEPQAAGESTSQGEYLPSGVLEQDWLHAHILASWPSGMLSPNSEPGVSAFTLSPSELARLSPPHDLPAPDVATARPSHAVPPQPMHMLPSQLQQLIAPQIPQLVPMQPQPIASPAIHSAGSSPRTASTSVLNYAQGSGAGKYTGSSGPLRRVGASVADAQVLSRAPLRVDMQSSRAHTVDHVVTPDGLVSLVRLTRKNEVTRGTAVLFKSSLPPLHPVRCARIDLIEGNIQVSLPPHNLDLPLSGRGDGDSDEHWATLDTHFFGSSTKTQTRLWQTQRRKTLFLFYCGSLWGVPVFITPRGESCNAWMQWRALDRALQTRRAEATWMGGRTTASCRMLGSAHCWADSTAR